MKSTWIISGTINKKVDKKVFDDHVKENKDDFEDWIKLIENIPDIAQLITSFKDTMINRNNRKYFYLSEIYTEHEVIFSQYQSYLKENRF